MDQAQPYGRTTVADGVGDQFADDEPGGELDLLHPAGQLLSDVRPGPGHADGVTVQVPAGDVASAQDVGACEEQRDVVVGSISRQQGVEHGVAGCLQGEGGLGECLADQGDTRFDVVVAAFDQAIGVEGKDAAFGEVELRRFERKATQAQRWSGWQFEEVGGSVKAHHGGQHMPRAGEGALAGDGVVDGVQAGGAVRAPRWPAGGRLRIRQSTPTTENEHTAPWPAPDPGRRRHRPPRASSSDSPCRRRSSSTAS
ncbi:hypothetical protein ACZ91_10875 [Streptomyces regensis]|nr:hypothetical protein ACZ91_10875 [Streptomyces regensis]KOG59749.1 hypothetical protein ADK77_38820 [Streptomyces antibioticus]